jgi:hypothetical protein
VARERAQIFLKYRRICRLRALLAPKGAGFPAPCRGPLTFSKSTNGTRNRQSQAGRPNFAYVAMISRSDAILWRFPVGMAARPD